MHINEADIIRLDRAAVLASIEVAAQVRPADLDRPTPCAGWAVRALLAHMTTQHRGFAAAARGNGADPAVWVAARVDDPVKEYAAAAEDVLAAFAAAAGDFVLPEISNAPSYPPATAISFHFIDYVVHGWDLARSIGAAYHPAADVLAAALMVAQAVPAGPGRLEPGAAFAPPVPVPDTADPLDRVLASLGRSPTWPA